MKIGIIGLPNTGKTTVFNALTSSNVFAGSYASPGGEHHLGQVHVPDPRFDELVRMYEPKKEVPATIEFVDVAGMTRSAGGERGPSEEMLHFVRDVDALIHVVRMFEDQSVPLPEDGINPAHDIRAVDTEMILNDLMAVEKRLERLEKEIQRLPRDKRQQPAAEKEIMERFLAHLESEQPLRTLEASGAEMKLIRGYAFLSLQPMMVLLNIGEDRIASSDKIAAMHEPESRIPVMAVCAKIEAEIAQLDGDDAAVFMKEMGIAESGLDRVIRAAYDLLGLQSFFTVGKDEVRAWTIRKGDDAVTAAGKIHSDMARGFIRAEVVAYDDLVAAGSWAGAKEQGKFRLEGKNYIVQDGDVISVRFNV